MNDAGRKLVDERQREDEENNKLIDWSGLPEMVDALPSEEEWIAKIEKEIAEEEAAGKGQA
jgi:hypothetical protein